MSAVPPRLAAAIAPVLGMAPGDVTPDTPLRGIVDSLDMVDLVVAAEDAFGVRIPDDAAERFGTVGEVAAFIAQAGASHPV